MSTTVLEALEGAKINFETVGRMGASRNPIFAIALDQLSNAIAALENGHYADTVIQDGIGSLVKTD